MFIFQEGERIIEDFLKSVKNLPLDTLTDEQLKNEISNLKAGVESKNNLYIKDIVSF